MKKRSIFWVCISTMLTLASCSSEELSVNDKKSQLNSITSIDEYDKSQLMNQFGQALSKVVFENKEVREFLKNEAVSQFDKNYDILWVKVCNEQIGNKSLRNLLVDKTSETLMDQVEKEIPQLNVLFPKIAMLGVEPEKYDTEDNELPVIVPNDSCNLMYFDGECVDSIPFGDAPAFNVLVVNENSRVIVNNGMKTKSGANSYKFIDPVFDGTQKEKKTKSSVYGIYAFPNVIGEKAINSYNYYNNLDPNANNSIYRQREYLYYGVMPEQQIGTFNSEVQDYITFIEVEPEMYFIISDQTSGNNQTQNNTSSNINNYDPIIKNCNNNGTATVSRKKRDFTTEELINELWTQGAYNIRFDILTSKSNRSIVKYIDVKPEDIWEFNLEREYVHKTMFRHSKYTYTINPNKFTSKRYILKTPLSLGSWDLSTEAKERYIFICEEDSGIENEDLIYINMHYSNLYSDGRTETKSFIFNRNIASDDLGMTSIDFYDPIIKARVAGISYVLGTYYHTGSISFGITTY